MSARPTPRDNVTANGWPITVARQVPHERPVRSRAPVTHSYAALGFVTRGGMKIEQGGEWIVAEGDVLLVPAGAPHRMIELKGAEQWGLNFCVPCFAEEAASLLAPFERVRDGAAPVVRIPPARRPFLEELFGELSRVTKERDATGNALDAVSRSLLTLILNEVSRASASTVAAGPSTRSVVVDALRFIERNCLRRLTLKEVASAVGKSPAYVTSALKQATGRSVNEWVVSSRMAEARRLLLHSDEMIDVVAERVGYADVTHFIRMFRRLHGATPAAWRAAQTAAVASKAERPHGS